MTDGKLAFSDLGLSEELLESVDRKGFEEPSDIQAMTIPVMLKDTENIIAQAQTGTGKTAAFGLPLLQLLDASIDAVQAIVLVPTRELAIQVSEEINSLRHDRRLQVVPIYGGQSIGLQLRRLKRGVHIVVGTPGRVIDHLKRKTLNLENINHLVLDEADEMLNMGFVEDIEQIMEYTGPQKKTLLFSATIPKKIETLAEKYMDGYRVIRVENKQLTTDLTEQIYYEVRASDKFEALCRIIDIEAEFYGLVFCRTKSDVDSVVGHLLDRGYDSAAIHGDISQAERERVLIKFRKQQINVLVATDVAARGIDVSNLTHVINYSIPYDPESYVHRIGRTGRAGNQGTAITFITPSEYKRLMFIQRIAKTDIKKSKVPDIEEIIEVRKEAIHSQILSTLDTPVEGAYYNWAKNLLAEKHPTEIVAAMLHHCYQKALDPDVYSPIKDVASNAKASRPKDLDLEGKSRLFVAMGKKDRMTPQKVVKLLTDRAGIKGQDISDIEIMDNFTFITVPFETAEAVVHAFRDKGRKPLVTMAKNPKVLPKKSTRKRETRKRWRGNDEKRGGRDEKRGGRDEKRERSPRKRRRRSE